MHSFLTVIPKIKLAEFSLSANHVYILNGRISSATFLDLVLKYDFHNCQKTKNFTINYGKQS